MSLSYGGVAQNQQISFNVKSNWSWSFFWSSTSYASFDIILQNNKYMPWATLLHKYNIVRLPFMIEINSLDLEMVLYLA